MSSLKAFVCFAMMASMLTACIHWSRVDTLDEVVDASRVRIESDVAPPIVLDHPSVERVAQVVASVVHARVEVRRLWGWPTALIITGAVLATAFTALVFLGLAAASIAGG
jgi:hypothetical protein